MTNKLFLSLPLLVLGTLTAAACNNDVDTSPWLPNYVDSGYGGARPAGGAGGAGGNAGRAGAGGAAGEAAADAGEAGAP